MSLFSRSNSREKIILPIRTNLKTYNEIPEHTIISANTNLPAELDGETVIARYRNLTINAGCTLTPLVRCCGMVLVVDGDLTINGTISMTARGANYQPTSDYRVKNTLLPGNNIVYEIDIPASADEVAAFLKKEKTRYHSWSELPAIYRPTLYTSSPRGYLYTSSDLCTIPSVGGLGGTISGPGVTASEATDRKCAGGGKGGDVVNGSGVGGNGGAGTCYSGGAGGGGVMKNGITGGVGSDIGGAGGDAGGPTGYGFCAGGGAGNPGGAKRGNASSAGGTGTGGLLIIICTGKIEISPTGAIVSKGSNGGAGGAYTSNDGSGGGGSGGGSINIFYNEYVNLGTISSNGGIGGHGDLLSAAGYASNGGSGCITIDKYNF